MAQNIVLPSFACLTLHRYGWLAEDTGNNAMLLVSIRKSQHYMRCLEPPSVPSPCTISHSSHPKGLMSSRKFRRFCLTKVKASLNEGISSQPKEGMSSCREVFNGTPCHSYFNVGRFSAFNSNLKNIHACAMLVQNCRLTPKDISLILHPNP